MRKSTCLTAQRLIRYLLLLTLPLHAQSDTISPINVAGIPLWIQATPDLQRQRQTFLDAENALVRGQLTRYRTHQQQLVDYPLLPYLEYNAINRRLSTAKSDEISAFLTNYPDSYLAGRLNRNWLQQLVRKQRWEEFARFYDPATADTELQCHSLLAQYKLGNEAILADAGQLWNVAKSQPDACDPLFSLWIKHGYLTDEIAWDRFQKTLSRRNYTLARYLTRFLSADQQRLAKEFRQLLKNPTLITNTTRFSSPTAENRSMILNGIRQLARKDSLLAWSTWQTYDAQHLFAESDRNELTEYLGVRLAMDGNSQSVEEVTASLHQLDTTDLIEAAVRQSLKQQDWESTRKYLLQLPAEIQQKNNWQYWMARSLEHLNLGTPVFPTAQSIYQELAKERDFYGFLAADRLNQQYSFQDKPIKAEAVDIDQIAALPAVKRARELLALGRLNDARREWFSMTGQLDKQQHLAAASLAQSWGWHRITIQALASAQAWDDLNLRFPLAYGEHVQKAADKLDIAPPVLFAIARQESAFAPDARSPAGALGLMQLMPGTARDSANKAGVKLSHQYDLLTPETNIELGSFYIDQLLSRFNGNRILAIAAYNAGPHRVQSWLSDDENLKLPYDVWIETIPFQETRHYVTNVLSYSVIYGYRLGSPQAVITDQEAAQKL